MFKHLIEAREILRSQHLLKAQEMLRLRHLPKAWGLLSHRPLTISRVMAKPRHTVKALVSTLSHTRCTRLSQLIKGPDHLKSRGMLFLNPHSSDRGHALIWSTFLRRGHYLIFSKLVTNSNTL